MHFPLTDIEAYFEINRLVKYQITAKRNYLHRRTDVAYDNKGHFFWKKKEEKNTKKSRLSDMQLAHNQHSGQFWDQSTY